MFDLPSQASIEFKGIISFFEKIFDSKKGIGIIFSDRKSNLFFWMFEILYIERIKVTDEQVRFHIVREECVVSAVAGDKDIRFLLFEKRTILQRACSDDQCFFHSTTPERKTPFFFASS